MGELSKKKKRCPFYLWIHFNVWVVEMHFLCGEEKVAGNNEFGINLILCRPGMDWMDGGMDVWRVVKILE